VLGVSHTASPQDIRAAFLVKAKALHPDLQETKSTGDKENGAANSESFVLLTSAYEVLRNPRRRQQYDMYRAAEKGDKNPSAGFAASVHSRHPAMDGAEAEAERWLQWLYHSIGGRHTPQGALIHYNGGAIRSALLNAYLGPWVDVEQGLPPCFEGEERNAGLTGIHDLMHIVSGRQLLGLVRTLPSLQLAPSHPWVSKASDLQQLHRRTASTPQQATTELESASSVQQCQHIGSAGIGGRCPKGTAHQQSWASGSEAGPCQRAHNSSYSRASDQQEYCEGTLPWERAWNVRSGRHSCNGALELTLGSKVVARAVRSPAGTAMNEASAFHGCREGPLPVRCTEDGFLDQDVISVWVLPEHPAGQSAAKTPLYCLAWPACLILSLFLCSASSWSVPAQQKQSSHSEPHLFPAPW